MTILRRHRCSTITLLLAVALLAGCAGLKLPEARLPEVTLPDVSLPNVDLPDVELPDLRLPSWLPGAGRARDPSPTALTVAAWPLPPEEQAHIEAQTAAFSAANAGVTATLTLLDDYARTLPAALAGDAPPDVLLLDMATLPALAAAGLLAPAPEALVADSDFHPLLTAAASPFGSLVCAPRDVQTLALLYNIQLFNEDGVALPTAQWTWAELRSAVQTISAGPTIHFTPYGMAMPPDAVRFVPFLLQAGGGWPPAGSGPAPGPTAEALRFFAELYTSGDVAAPELWSSPWAGEVFGNGRAGMVVEGGWAIPYLAAEHPTRAYGVAPLPAGPGGRGTLAFGTCYGVAARSSQPEAAWALVRALTGFEAMQAALESSAAIPARQSLAGLWAQRHPGQIAFLDSLDFATLWQLPAGEEDRIGILNAHLAALLAGDETSEEAAAALAEEFAALGAAPTP